MRFGKRCLTVAVGTLVLVGAAGPLANASVSTDRYMYVAGDTVQITGDQMSANENVTVDVGLPDGSLSQEHVVVADDNGGFSDTYTLASDAPDGIYSVVATGQSSGNVFTTTFDPAAGNCMDDSSVTGDAASQTGFTVNWTDGCTQEDGFRIMYGTASGGPYGTTVDADADTSSKALSGLDCDTTYYFVVQAWKQDGPGEQNSTSDEGSATTLACSSGTGPTADAGGPYSGDEGDAIALDGSGSTGTDLTYAWSLTDVSAASDDSPGNDGGPDCSFDDATSATPNLTCNDDSDSGAFEVTLTVTDGDDLTDTDTADVTVSNVAPEVATSDTWTLTPSNCSVNVTAGFNDAGLNDTHTASIDWGDSNQTVGTVTEETSSTAGSVSGSHTYAGPGTYNVKVTVTDDDGDNGDATYTGFNNNPTVVFPQPPIMSAKSFNTGSTIPVKVAVTGCTSGLNPTISVTPTVITVKSSGKSNLQDTLRYTSALPGFIYNWSTKGWTAQSYVVTINGLPGGAISAPVTLTK